MITSTLTKAGRATILLPCNFQFKNFYVIAPVPKTEWMTYNSEHLIKCELCNRYFITYTYFLTLAPETAYNQTNRKNLKCLCQNKRTVLYKNLQENDYTSLSVEYKTWGNLKYRASRNLIQVQQSWLDNFITFISDVGSKPDLNYFASRYDENDPYEKHNFYWKEHDSFRLVKQEKANQLKLIAGVIE